MYGGHWRFTGRRYVHFIFRIHGVSLTMSWKIFPAIGRRSLEVVEDAGGLVSDILLSPFGLLTIYTGGLEDNIYISLKCVRCVRMCERGGRSTCVSACEHGRTYFLILNV